MDTNWKSQAACRPYPVQLWYSSRSDESIKEAIAICETCDVRVECLSYAVKNKESVGVWGGKTPEEIHTIIWKRTKIRR